MIFLLLTRFKKMKLDNLKNFFILILFATKKIKKYANPLARRNNTANYNNLLELVIDEKIK